MDKSFKELKLHKNSSPREQWREAEITYGIAIYKNYYYSNKDLFKNNEKFPKLWLKDDLSPGTIYCKISEKSRNCFECQNNHQSLVNELLNIEATNFQQNNIIDLEYNNVIFVMFSKNKDEKWVFEPQLYYNQGILIPSQYYSLSQFDEKELSNALDYWEKNVSSSTYKIQKTSVPQIDKKYTIWNQIHIGQEKFKDAVIINYDAFDWNWNWDPRPPLDTMMHHNPGYRIIDIEHFLSGQQVEIMIFSLGYDSALQMNIEPELLIKYPGVIIYIDSTDQTTKKYEECREKGKSILYFHHSTC